MKLLQIVVFLAAGCGLIYLRDTEPGLHEPLSNGYAVAALSAAAAFVATIVVLAPGEILTRVRRRYGDAKRSRFLKSKQGLNERIPRGRA
jgi:hypothetical protein